MKKKAQDSTQPTTPKRARTEANRRVRVARDARLKRLAQDKKLRVPRGTQRALRRRNMDQFNLVRKSRKLNTGTVRVNAPSLDMLNQLVQPRQQQ